MLLDIGDVDEGPLDVDPALRATDKDLEAMSLLTRELAVHCSLGFFSKRSSALQ